MKPRVFLEGLDERGSNYVEVIRAGLQFCGFGQGLPENPKIFIKPNLTFPTFDRAS